MKRINIIAITICIFMLLAASVHSLFSQDIKTSEQKTSWWKVQSIDTMKYSRDVAREKLNDASYNQVIARQTRDIAKTGATHIAIATPYDEEFTPFLARWVSEARKNNLKVWFRGNLSGWEKWFGHERISREEHTKKIYEFIKKHPELFEDDDIFTSCPECENGGPGDPRHTGDKVAYRQFLITENKTAQKAFSEINKKVNTNYYSMNGDVARLIMDKPTTQALGGVVVIDHYVKTPEKLIKDIREISVNSGGKIVLGEFGAPIPDIHGELSETEQAAWLEKALNMLAREESVVGLNYWVSVGGSTELWNAKGESKKAVETLTKAYTPNVLKGQILNAVRRPITNATITVENRIFQVDKNAEFQIPYLPETSQFTVEAKDYYPLSLSMPEAVGQNTFILQKRYEGFLMRLARLLETIIGTISLR